jgi:hypothetical protein
MEGLFDEHHRVDHEREDMTLPQAGGLDDRATYEREVDGKRRADDKQRERKFFGRNACW